MGISSGALDRWIVWKLDTTEGEKTVFRIAKQRDAKRKDVEQMT